MSTGWRSYLAMVNVAILAAAKRKEGFEGLSLDESL